MQFAQLGRWVALGLAVLLGGSLMVGKYMPSQVEISRSALIAAPPGTIYPLIADFRAGWTRWSTFADEDPGITYTYAGPSLGLGAVQDWKSKKMGDGHMTIIKADSLAGIGFEILIGEAKEQLKLEGVLAMAPEAGGTRLTWTDRGDLGANPGRRLLAPLMVKMMGHSFEKSLAAIKRIAETAPAPSPNAADTAGTPTAAQHP